MPVHELENLLQTTLAPYRSQALQQNIIFTLFDDHASTLVLDDSATRLTSLIDTVMQGTLGLTDATEVRFATRQLLRTSTDVLLELSLEHNAPFARPQSRTAYFRSLVTARRLIRALHGTSETSISPRHGTVLKFIIRCTATEKEGDSTGICAQSLQQKRVLVVEDNEMNQLSIARILQQQGMQCCIAPDGRVAIELFEKQRFDLVLMDLHMPGMDGLETTRYLRRNLQSALPFIGMSAGQGYDQAHLCFEAGMNQFIKKPFTPDLLITQLCSFFEPLYLQLTPVRALSA